MLYTTYDILLDELSRHDYGGSLPYRVDDLFKIYLNCEINKFEDIYNYPSDFYDFVKLNINQFRGADTYKDGKMSVEDERFIRATTRQCILNFRLLTDSLFANHRRYQEDFVHIIEEIIGNTKPRLLDVGSGKIPYSSLLLARNTPLVASMDRFLLSDETLRKLKVIPYNKYFEQYENLSYYDFVIGKKPCSAIDKIVINCTREKKPYFIQLCDCEAPAGELAGWRELLSHIDKKIKFTKNNNFAYNLDTPQTDLDSETLSILYARNKQEKAKKEKELTQKLEDYEDKNPVMY